MSKTFCSFFARRSRQICEQCVEEWPKHSKGVIGRSEKSHLQIFARVGTSSSHSTSVHWAHSNEETASVSNTLPEIRCPQKDKAVIFKEKRPIFPVLGGWRASTSFAQAPRHPSNGCNFCGRSELGFNHRLEEKLIADILALIKLSPLHKENVQMYFLDSGCLLFCQCKSLWSL